MVQVQVLQGDIVAQAGRCINGHECPSHPWSGMMREMVKGLLLILILVVGIVLQAVGVIDLSGVHAWLAAYAAHWWAPVLLVALMTVLYAFALPGSTLMLVAGVMYSPLWATGCTVLGGVFGGLAAYRVVRLLSREWVRRYADSPLFRIMQEHAGFLLLSALRILPGFPHSVINYSAGMLRVNRWVFIASTALGHAVKGFVYTSAMYHATHVESEADALSWQTLWPLIALSALMGAGYLFRSALRARRSSDAGRAC